MSGKALGIVICASRIITMYWFYITLFRTLKDAIHYTLHFSFIPHSVVVSSYCSHHGRPGVDWQKTTTIHSHNHSRWPIVHVLSGGGNPHRHRENTKTPQRKAPSGPGSEPRTFLLCDTSANYFLPILLAQVTREEALPKMDNSCTTTKPTHWPYSALGTSCICLQAQCQDSHKTGQRITINSFSQHISECYAF